MQPRKVRHTAAILTVTIASGLLFSISSLNERKNPAGTSDLTTLVHTRQAQVAALDAEVGALDAQIQNFSTSQPGAPTPDEDAFTAKSTRPPAASPSAQPPTTSSSTSRTSKTP